MLTIGKLRDPNYYLAQVAAGLEEYYSNAKEAPGVWMGSSAERLGLSGEVDGEVLHRVLDHRDPKTITRLTRAQGAPKVPGFDATFCAPKSVSLLLALGNPEVSNEVRNAHDAAVGEAVRAMEDFGARARRGKAGAERLVPEGFVAAAFRHRTSRAADPHLHTHILIPNLVFSPQDGWWSALDARPLYGWAKTVGYLYEAKLREELTRRLGVEWAPVRRGIADIEGISKKTLRSFSRRRAEIEAHMAERGETTARAAQVATYATRKPKDRSVETEGLMPEWRERARTLGLDDEALAGLVGRVTPELVPEPGTTAAEELFAALAAPDGLTAQVSTFGRKEILQGICDRLPGGAGIGQVVALAKEFVASDYVVEIGVPDRLWTSDVLRRLDGTVVPAHLDLLRWTTPEMLATENRLIDGARSRALDSVGIADTEHVAAALAARPTLSAEQIAMVEHLTGSGTGVDVVVGVAGSGKTFALGAARDAWESSGCRVLGAALSARAAAELQDGSGIPSTTLARLLADLDRRDTVGLPRHCVLVVDEGAMVGTRQLARLLDHAQGDGAKVVLVGDHHQLVAIEAGGAFAALAACVGATELTENRRQREGWERDALAELRHGNPDVALAAYQAHDRLHQARTSEQIRDRLVDDWWCARQTGGHHLMVAARHRDVDDLNRRARHRLIDAGVLGDEVAIGERTFAVGDDVLATRNDYRIMIFNGTRATITGIDRDARRIEAVDVHQRPLVIPFSYAEADHLTWGYATTLHKAQGATLDQTFLLADDTLHRERSYSGLSRGAEGNDLYLAVPDDEERHGAPEVDDLIERLRQTVNRSEAKALALEDLLSARPRSTGAHWRSSNGSNSEPSPTWPRPARNDRPPKRRSPNSMVIDASPAGTNGAKRKNDSPERSEPRRGATRLSSSSASAESASTPTWMNGRRGPLNTATRPAASEKSIRSLPSTADNTNPASNRNSVSSTTLDETSESTSVCSTSAVLPLAAVVGSKVMRGLSRKFPGPRSFAWSRRPCSSGWPWTWSSRCRSSGWTCGTIPASPTGWPSSEVNTGIRCSSYRARPCRSGCSASSGTSGTTVGGWVLERGLDHLSPRGATATSLFAIVGLLQLILVAINMMVVVAGPYSGQWTDEPAHVINGVCDTAGFTGTRYGPCPEAPGYRAPLRDLPGPNPPAGLNH